MFGKYIRRFCSEIMLEANVALVRFGGFCSEITVGVYIRMFHWEFTGGDFVRSLSSIGKYIWIFHLQFAFGNYIPTFFWIFRSLIAPKDFVQRLRLKKRPLDVDKYPENTFGDFVHIIRSEIIWQICFWDIVQKLPSEIFSASMWIFRSEILFGAYRQKVCKQNFKILSGITFWES